MAREPNFRQSDPASIHSIMKMLFFSADSSEVELANKEFTTAGIPCEIRKSGATRPLPQSIPHVELWIRNDKDCHRAMMLCVQLGIGFSRRPTPQTTGLLEDLEATAPH
jgi:hypothetical protein